MRGCGSLVLVEGDAGIGKSRLLQEFESSVGAEARVAHGACLPYASAPFGPIAEVMRAIVHAHPSAAPPAAYLRTVLRTIVPDIRPPFEIVTSDSALVRRWMLDAIAETVNRLSASTPVLIVIEDLHWADADTLAAITYLASRLDDLRAVLAVSYRHEAARAPAHFTEFLNATSRFRVTNRVSLEDLPERDARALIASAAPAGSRVSPVQADRIYRLAGGNPLFLQELVKHHLESTGTRPLPSSLEGIFRDRLARLSAFDADVLTVASALHGEFTPADIAANGLDPASVRSSLTRALQDGMVAQTSRGGDEVRYGLRSHLLREMLYAGLEPARALTVHRTAALRLESANVHDCAALAYHWRLAGDSERAFRYGLEAADEAAASYAYERAISLYEMVLPLALDDRTRAGIHEKLARMNKNAGSGDEALRHTEAAAAIFRRAGSADDIARSSLRLSSLRAREWSERSLHDAESALAAAGNDPASRWGFAAHVRIAEALYMLGRTDEARAHVNAAAPFAADGEQRHTVLFTQIRSWLAFLDGDPRCVSMALDAVASARAIGDPENLPGICCNAANMALERGEPATAAAQFAAAIESADHYRLAPMLSYAKISYAFFLCEYGTFTEAAATLADLGDPPLDSRWLTAAASSVAMRIALARGDADALERWSDPAYLEVSRTSGDATRFGPHAGAHARIAARSGDHERAFTLLSEAVEMMRDADGNHATLISVASSGLAERIPRARAILEQTAQRWNVERSRGYLHLFDALAATAQRERLEHAYAAVRIFEHLGMRFHAARAYDAGGDGDTAAKLYEQTGAAYHAAMLASSNAKRRLSKREDEIAQLIARGRTNKEIGATLGVSDRTVENHVASILRKLKLRSRTEVAARIASETRKSV